MDRDDTSSQLDPRRPSCTHESEVSGRARDGRPPLCAARRNPGPFKLLPAPRNALHGHANRPQRQSQPPHRNPDLRLGGPEARQPAPRPDRIRPSGRARGAVLSQSGSSSHGGGSHVIQSLENPVRFKAPQCSLVDDSRAVIAIATHERRALPDLVGFTSLRIHDPACMG